MHTIHKKILTDEAMHPIGVLIDYKDWLDIEKALHLSDQPSSSKLAKFKGTIHLTEDPLEFQKKNRNEWK